MRILHFITSLRTGGAERLVTDLSAQLRKGGDTVSLLVLDGTRTPLMAQAERSGVAVDALSSGWRAMRNPLLLVRLVRYLRTHPCEIVHTHNTSCQLMAAAASAFLPLTLVTTEHNTANRRRERAVFRVLDRWMYARYRRIVCVGGETRSALEAWLDREELSRRMEEIPNGVDLQGIPTAAPAPDLALQEGYKLLMVSAFRPEKDQQTLIRSLALLPSSYHLFLAGGAETPSHQAILEACKTLTSSLNLCDRVHFLGPRIDVPGLYAAADLVSYSSHHEGMSLSVLEGMASGKPLIASDVAGMRELVGGAGLLFPEGDAEALAACIRQICEHPALARSVAARCRERAARFDIAETARRYRQLYETIIQTPS